MNKDNLDVECVCVIGIYIIHDVYFYSTEDSWNSTHFYYSLFIALFYDIMRIHGDISNSCRD